MAIDRTRSGSEISNGRQLHLLRVRIQILCVWCFDFMELDGENWPPPSLVARKQKRGRAPAMERSSLRPPFRAFQQRRAATCGTLSTGSRRYRVKAEARAASIGQMRLDQSEVRAVARAEQGAATCSCDFPSTQGSSLRPSVCPRVQSIAYAHHHR